MYKLFIRPLFFLFDPETIHHFTLSFLKIVNSIPLVSSIFNFFLPKVKSKPIELFGLRFNHPVGLAAGFDKNAEYIDELSNFGFSFIEIGAVTPLGQKGNPRPRIFRLKKNNALINRMGFNNKGLDNAIKNLKKRKSGVIVGANIGKNTNTPNDEANNDYVKCFKEMHDYVDYFTVNVSCPNIKDLKELQDKEALLELLTELKNINISKEKPKPILLKISPDLTWVQLDDTLEIIKRTGIDGIVAVNTTTSRSGLDYSEKEINDIGNGGLSGLPLKNRATEMIKYIHDKTNGELPIIGVGGIMNSEDIKEKLDAGASLVQVFTGFIYEGPGIVKQ